MKSYYDHVWIALDRIGIVLGSCWELGTYWDRNGIAFGSCYDRIGWDRVGMVMTSYWERVRIILESRWNHIAILLGSCWIVLGSCWDRAGSVLGT